mmetsp:Transcript_9903/g.20472  ORF Transcript_9903/g.20472 Transcript_9903/m.20472 type:complete len:93 (-) Transcript_9903:285-563(-)
MVVTVSVGAQTKRCTSNESKILPGTTTIDTHTQKRSACRSTATLPSPNLGAFFLVLDKTNVPPSRIPVQSVFHKMIGSAATSSKVANGTTSR